VSAAERAPPSEGRHSREKNLARAAQMANIGEAGVRKRKTLDSQCIQQIGIRAKDSLQSESHIRLERQPFRILDASSQLNASSEPELHSELDDTW
jgi:hypothetical protein